MRSELDDAHQRSRDGQAIAVGLGVAGTQEDIVRVTTDGALVLGATGSAIFWVERDDLVVRRCAGDWTEASRDESLAAAVSTKRAQWFPGGHSIAGAVPMVLKGACVGVLAMTFASDRLPTEGDRIEFEGLASQCGHAMEHARCLNEARQLLQFERQLIGVVAHDLRNPLSVIAMTSEVMGRRYGDKEEDRRLCSRVKMATERALRITADLMMFTQVRTGDLLLQLSLGDVFHVLALCVEDFQLRTPGREFSLSCTGDGSACLDEDRLRDVMTTLLSNAAAHGSPNTRVEIRGVGLSEVVRIEVTNRGPVLGPRKLMEIWEPAVGRTTAGRRNGIGLGLYIAKGIMEAHHGRIGARSDEEQGTTFTVELPRGGEELTGTTA